jgi:hypothetical protein
VSAKKQDMTESTPAQDPERRQPQDPAEGADADTTAGAEGVREHSQDPAEGADDAAATSG